MRVDAKSLIRKLTPTATRLLEAAVGRAAGGGFYEITEAEERLSSPFELTVTVVPRRGLVVGAAGGAA